MGTGYGPDTAGYTRNRGFPGFGCAECPANTVCTAGTETPAKCPFSDMFVHDNACWACPILSSENNEATCRDGVLRFKQGHWHDGLQLANGTVQLVDWLPRGSVSATTSHFVVQPTALSGPFVRNSTQFYQCPQESWCEVHNESGAVACAKGRGGVFCASCLPDHYRDVSSDCRPCSEGSVDVEGFATFFGIYLILPLCLWLWFRSLVRRSELMRILVSRVMSLVFGKLKIAAGFYTVVILFESVYALPFPSIYIRFVSIFQNVGLEIRGSFGTVDGTSPNRSA